MKVKWHQQSLAKEPPPPPTPPLLKAPTDVKQSRTQVLMHCMGLYTMSVLQTLLMAKWSKASPSHFFFIFLMQKTKHRSKQKISHSKNKVQQKWSLNLKSDLLIKSHIQAGLWLKSFTCLYYGVQGLYFPCSAPCTWKHCVFQKLRHISISSDWSKVQV